MAKVIFETLIDESIINISNNNELKKFLNKNVLSIINDFEDGKWRHKQFQEYLWNNIIQTALSERERRALTDDAYSTLCNAARNLRLTDNDHIGQGSEIAEIFLYGVMKNHYKALPVIPKIFYKQNVNDNVKGADSVHIVINEEGDDFTLWFGEAKFYTSIENCRLDSIVKSVHDTLNTEKLKKENSIITNIPDLDSLIENKSLCDNIKMSLSGHVSIDLLKPKIHIPILIIHQCNNTDECTEISDDYRQKIITYHTERAEAYFLKQSEKSSHIHKYLDITFHLILFPVPNKKLIVDKFLKSASFFKGEV